MSESTEVRARKVEIHYEKFWAGDSKILIDGVEILKTDTQPGCLEDLRLTIDVDKSNMHRARLYLTFGVYPDELAFIGAVEVFPELKDGLRFYKPRSRLLATVFNPNWWKWQWWKRCTKQGRARHAALMKGRP